MSNVDLTLTPPRSPRVRLGSFVLLPRILDKCRATLAGKNGEYKFNCPLDRQFFDFTQVDAEAFKAEVKAGKGDGEMLEWIQQNAGRKVSAFEAMAWSALSGTARSWRCGDARVFHEFAQASRAEPRGYRPPGSTCWIWMTLFPTAGKLKLKTVPRACTALDLLVLKKHFAAVNDSKPRH